LSLAIILLIAILGIAGYAITKYHGEAWDWVAQKYQTVTNWVSEELSNFKEPSVITPVNTPTLPEATMPTITPLASTIPTQIINFEALFNEYRLSSGLSPLEFTDDLNRIAKLRLAEIQVNYSHFSTGGYNKHLAENINMISSRYLSDTSAFNSWISSSGHRANILNPSFRYTGYANGGGYAIQVFSEYITINGEPQLPAGWYWND
jgi:uncharacterized protein YkwD